MAILRNLVYVHPGSEIHTAGKRFARRVLETKMHSDVLARLQWHQKQGHETVIVSASLDVYLRPIAEDLGIDEVICTTLEIKEGHATGRLVGRNVRAAEKARLLGELLGADKNVELYAYGNSPGDHELLAAATHPFWVTKKGKVSPYTP